jgi:hypothetical protein
LPERKCTSRSSDSNCGRLEWSAADLLQLLGGADHEAGVDTGQTTRIVFAKMAFNLLEKIAQAAPDADAVNRKRSWSAINRDDDTSSGNHRY